MLKFQKSERKAIFERYAVFHSHDDKYSKHAFDKASSQGPLLFTK